ncbi:MAG: hypothetical protein PHV02_05005 [Rhodocyclaceae bacterium]|nr:hypothetical protein [Rhodocyclaceae bacterium]
MTNMMLPHLNMVLPNAVTQNLAIFIAEAKALTIFGKDLDWDHWNWPGVGNFTVMGSRRFRKTTQHSVVLLHPSFLDFAKAYVRYAESENPSKSARAINLAALRAVESALLIGNLDANPANITLATLNQAAQIVRTHFASKGVAYSVGVSLHLLARVMSRKGLTRNDIRSWSNPIAAPDLINTKLGAEADAHRQKRLPDERAIKGIGGKFADGFDLHDPSTHPDVYLTSTVALLLHASSRGQEPHELMIDAECEDYDQEGILRYGLRWHAGKNTKDPSKIKWGNSSMEPFVREAFRRMQVITDEPRAFARYCEQQLELRRRNIDVTLPFYRHAMCPDVPDDQPLNAAQVRAALGSKSTAWSILPDKGLSNKPGTYTLNSLWLWVLNRLPKGFPYVVGAKNKHLKYSEALFCMHKSQLKAGENSTTDPVSVWMPSIAQLSGMLGGATSKGFKSFFERHGILDETGTPLRLRSHSFRHLLDTIEHEGTGKDFLEDAFINARAGRSAAYQGATYNHSYPEDKAEIVRDALTRPDGSVAVIDLPKPAADPPQETQHWVVTRPGPRSCADIEINHRSAVLNTLWGGCEHDWLLEPCQYHRDCLNCKEHFCIKGAGKDDQERLERLRALLPMVIHQQQLAKVAMDKGKPGSKFWHQHQTDYRERIEQLIHILEDPSVPENSTVRLADGKANSHLHRVLREVVLRRIEDKSETKDVIDALESAFRENRALPIKEIVLLRLEQHHG